MKIGEKKNSNARTVWPPSQEMASSSPLQAVVKMTDWSWGTQNHCASRYLLVPGQGSKPWFTSSLVVPSTHATLPWHLEMDYQVKGGFGTNASNKKGTF